MWNDDEDNNPYGTSFGRRDSQTSSSINPASPSSRDYRPFDVPHTPTSGSEDEEPAFSQVTVTPHGDNHQTVETGDEASQRRKPGGYTSRIEQIFYENPDTPIIITDAGKSLESGGRYIVYTIRTGDLEVRRRYSEFASLREALTRLHPTLIIPPIPEKQTMADYAAKPTSAKQDQHMIDLRKRMLAVFLNRCRRMEAVRDDGVWWRFLDPNASWSEVLHSHPVASIPKSVLKAPPLDTANPSPAHNFLPVPSTSAKLKTSAGQHHYESSLPPAQTRTHVIGRFPPESKVYSEQDLDPYFVSYEASTKEMEQLLNGPMEKVNRRTLSHLSALATDLCELGSRFNAFALSEQAPSLGPAIERVGQAADLSYIATEELAGSLGASFAEPMRENAQFAGVVKSVLRYRVLKRVQQDLTAEELAKKRDLLEQLEQSEAEARRIEQYLSTSQQLSPPRKRSTSQKESSPQHRRDTGQEDTESIDSDFPPTHGDYSSSTPSVSQGLPDRSASVSHKKGPSGNSITNKIFGPLRHAIQGVADVDPERTRRDTIGKTRESIGQLEQAQVASERDVKEASESVLNDLKRFQKDKEDDLKRYMLAYAKSHVEWAKKSKQQWEEARAEVDKIDDN
ncbi:Sorting nexin, cytoplasm-to-vacuole targeting pathway/endosomal sorting [Claviceps arundinis]|uniref:Sorting nexin, cytoplasm-to-vacuole targeting pathway/endosomal sorting n=1 Tax=Claviceps arundinis TaxID=1623583 RepID=A0A9P7MU22_9HYPO|nr:Sorting nexin, cytoplasm-to-vacuole targeting pathway/endosomal sorting [Claviceps arundinis]KAG5969978.1 Sorting nexin, cytoplasm-to-vacuole targeting pathway/endosomal sorting [Claviceps arundinis]